MAIKIIDTVPHHSVVKEVICRHCGVTLQYTPSDVKSRVVSDYTGSTDTYRHITCPACSTDIEI